MVRTMYRLSLAFCSLLGAACGSVKETPDASTIDADQSGTATVKTEAALFGTTGSIANIDVVSMLPNNTLLEAIKTGADGLGSIKVYPGGSVTAVYRRPGDTGAELISYLGAKPNDTLTFGNRNPLLLNNVSLGTQTYEWTVQAPGASQHCAATSCSASCSIAPATNVVFAELASCNRTPMDVLYVARNAMNQTTHYSLRTNVTFSAGATVSTTFWQAAPNATVNITGVPAEVTQLFGQWLTVLNLQDERSLASSYSGNPTGGAFTTTFGFHATGRRTVGRVQFQRLGSFDIMTLLDSFNTNTLTQTVASPQFTPWLQGVLASAPLRKVTWNAVATAASATDGTVVSLQWDRMVGATNQFYRWYLIVPPGVSSIALPDLPAPLNSLLPPDDRFLGATVRLFDVPATGYDAVRALPSRNVMCIECAVRAGDFQRAVFSGNVF